MIVSQNRRVIVVGGGVAGQMAAWFAAQSGASVLLLEKMHQLGLKMGITGKGRCNLTNIADVEDIIHQTPGNGKFLFSAYKRFSNRDLLDLFDSWGLKTKVERGGRVFPISDSAQEVRAIFRNQLQKIGVRIRLNEDVQRLLVHDGTVCGVETKRDIYQADAVIICAGGASYPQTGSDGSGCVLAKGVGHTIVPLRPSLIPLVCKESVCKDLQGLSLKNVDVTIFVDAKKKKTLRGEMLFTHFGVSGPLILTLSDVASKALVDRHEVRVDIDLKPALSIEVLMQRIERDFELFRMKKIEHAMERLLPKRMIVPVLIRANVDLAKRAVDLSRSDIKRIATILKGFSLEVVDTLSIKQAIVTAGGVSVKEVNPKTMESKLVSGLYFSGEVLDIHAYTGGFNLQAAFSMGAIAGMAAAGGRNE